MKNRTNDFRSHVARVPVASLLARTTSFPGSRCATRFSRLVEIHRVVERGGTVSPIPFSFSRCGPLPRIPPRVSLGRPWRLKRAPICAPRAYERQYPTEPNHRCAAVLRARALNARTRGNQPTNRTPELRRATTKLSTAFNPRLAVVITCIWRIRSSVLPIVGSSTLPHEARPFDAVPEAHQSPLAEREENRNTIQRQRSPKRTGRTNTERIETITAIYPCATFPERGRFFDLRVSGQRVPSRPRHTCARARPRVSSLASASIFVAANPRHFRPRRDYPLISHNFTTVFANGIYDAYHRFSN